MKTNRASVLDSMIAAQKFFSAGIKLALLVAGLSAGTVFAQSWVTTPGGALPNDSVATNYFPYLATQTASGIAYGTKATEIGDVWIPNYNGKPAPANSNNRPAVVIVHGGGGTSGARTETRGTQTSQLLAAHGYVAFNIDYAIGKVYPQNVRDWRLAVRWLRANAATYGIDPNHIGITGGSFGGFSAALMSGITNGQRTLYPDSNATFNNISLDTDGQLSSYSGDVQCTIDFYGPSLFTGVAPYADGMGQFPSTATTVTYSNASPILYAHPGAAPVMICHGTSDTTVDIQQSRTFTNALKQASVAYVFDAIPGAAHTFCIYDTTKGGTWPVGSTSGTIDLRKDTMDFFDKYLLNAANPPSISIQPTSQSGCVGYAASFNVTAGGTTPLAYQWFGPGGGIAGATNSNYTIPSLATNLAGNYSVVITNSVGSITSSVVALTVNNLTPPAISSDPTNLTVSVGQASNFSVTATGDSLSYQWLFNNQVILSATNSTFNISSATNANAGSYQVIVFNSCSAVASAAATLAVNGPPTITGNPASVTACSGDSATLVVTAIGVSPLNYQWFGPSGIIGGATSNVLVLNNLSTTNTGAYYLTVTNAFGGVVSGSATLTVSANHVVSFTTQPTNSSATVGGTASFSIAVTGGGSYAYLWIRNDADPITDAVATNATLTFTNVTLADAGYYTCYVNNDCSTLSSSAATLAVSSAASSSTVVISEIYGAGGKATPTASYTNDYVVLKNVSAFSQSINGWSLQHQKAGTWQTPFNLPNASIPAGGYYLIKCFNDGSGLTASGSLPTPDAATPQTSAWNLSISGSGAVALVKNTTQLTGNSTNIMLTSAATNIVDLVGYFATATTISYIGTGVAPGGSNTNATKRLLNGCQNTPNNAIDFVLGTPTPLNSASPTALCFSFSAPVIVGQPLGQTNAAGSGITLTVTANGDAPLAYQWRKDAGNVSGATSALLNISPANTNDSGNYMVVVTNAYGSVTSSVAIVLITNIPPTPPVITLQPQSQMVVAGENPLFTITANGTSPLSYQWFKGVNPISGGTNATLNLSAVTSGDAGIYSVVVTNLYGSATSSNASLTVLAAGSYTNVVASSWATVRDGTNYNFDIDEASLGYVLTKYSLTGAAAKEYLQFDLAGKSPDTSASFTLTCTRFSSGGSQAVQLWALNQPYTSFSNNIVWGTAQANETNSNSMLTNGTFTATSLLTTFVGGGTGTNTFIIPAPWGQFVQNNKLILAITAMEATTPNTNSSAGSRVSIVSNSLPILRFSVNTGIASNQFYFAHDNGPGFNTGDENLYITNASGGSYSVWSSADPALPVTSWKSEGATAEFPIVSKPGNSVYGITVTPGTSPAYYIFARTNTGSYLTSEPLMWLTTDDYATFNLYGTNMPISTNGIFAFGTAPSITQHPQSQTATAGSGVTFSVAASGSAPLTYQWRKGGSPIGFATDTNYVINPVSLGDAGNYDVVVANSFGSVTSSVAVLTVSNPVPIITQSPSGKSVLVGQNASFVVVATGPGLNYQWQFNSANLNGATSSTLGLASVNLSQAGAYRVLVTNVYGAVTSSAALLGVAQPPAFNFSSTGGGAFQFSGGSLTGLTYVVQVATNLTSPNWISISTNNTGPGGTINYQPPANTAPNQFYRLVFP